MQSIKINFSDFWKGFDKENNFFITLLRQKYEVRVDPKPDFLIYSVFGMDYLKYDCIRIFYTGENFTPDFNLCDYALGFDWITFDDRYLRLPLYYIYRDSYSQVFANEQYSLMDLKDKKFCNFVYSNSGADELRTIFFETLSKYKFIHSGGKYLNNIGFRVDDKFEFQKQFKFSIAFENSSTNGYTTEKIIQAKGAGTVPIYWGNPKINREMNTRAFINCHDYKNFDEVIRFIKEVDKDEEKLLDIMNQPLFKDSIYLLNDTIFLNFFENIFSTFKKQRNGHFQANLERRYRRYSLLERLKNRILTRK